MKNTFGAKSVAKKAIDFAILVGLSNHFTQDSDKVKAIRESIFKKDERWAVYGYLCELEIAEKQNKTAIKAITKKSRKIR